MATTTLGVKLDDPTRERLKAAASSIDRTPHWLIKQAVLQYVESVERGELRRHRAFESNVPLIQPGCNHQRVAAGVDLEIELAAAQRLLALRTPRDGATKIEIARLLHAGDDGAAVEVDVLDAKACALEEPEAGAGREAESFREGRRHEDGISPEDLEEMLERGDLELDARGDLQVARVAVDEQQVDVLVRLDPLQRVLDRRLGIPISLAAVVLGVVPAGAAGQDVQALRSAIDRAVPLPML